MPSCSSRGSWSPCWAKRSKLWEPVFGSKKDTIVAGDNIGAGVGEMVLVTTDETTQHGLDHPSPIDAFIVGIVDNPPTLSK